MLMLVHNNTNEVIWLLWLYRVSLNLQRCKSRTHFLYRRASAHLPTLNLVSLSFRVIHGVLSQFRGKRFTLQ